MKNKVKFRLVDITLNKQQLKVLHFILSSISYEQERKLLGDKHNGELNDVFAIIDNAMCEQDVPFINKKLVIKVK